MEFIRIRDVEKTYPTGVTALYGLNLEIKKGDFVFIIGASGSGKSTLIKMLYREEKEQEEEFSLMKSYYPKMAKKIQEKVEEECDLLDYEGSRLYDEYPDRYMLYHLGRKIIDSISPQVNIESMPDGLLEELVQVMLFHEVSRRRCRRRRCRGWY